MWSPKSRTRLAISLLSLVSAAAQNRGQADFALQGYYLAGNSQPLLDTSGLSLRFQDFQPGLGLLNGSLEAYGAQNRLQTGENFLELQGLPWMGRHWTFTGGDFHTLAGLVEFPFLNLFNPEITARGFRAQAAHDGAVYTFFIGEETLTAGPRVPYRVLVPQTVAGASAVRKVARNFSIGARVMQFSASPSAIAGNPYLFPVGRDFNLVRTAAVQSLFAPNARLKIYAEVSRPLSGFDTLTSSFAGISYVSGAFTVRANYANLSAAYFPLAGYFAGDRRGPFGEARLRPAKWIEFFGSASQYRSNLENNPAVASLASTDLSGGLSATLPGRLSLSGQISTVRFTSRGGGQDTESSYNRQLSATLSRAIRRHALQASWRQIDVDTGPTLQRQTSTEVDDTFSFQRFNLGAGVRLQQTTGAARLNTMFYRGSAQGGLGRLTLFANLEFGNDLVNETVFSTSAYSTTIVGAGLRLTRNWTFQAEAFRSRLNVELNPENIFVLQGGGIPLPQTLAGIEQWSLFLRISRQFRWRGGLPAEALHPLAEAAVPLVGAVEGIARVKSVSAESLAPGIPITLDGVRSATTGADGRYRFEDVPEGQHTIALDSNALPAEYDPGPLNQARIAVQPRKTVRADFNVLPLSAIQGRVTGSEGAPLDGIVMRLAPGTRYTMTDAAGHFAFYNVREGDCDIVLDPQTLPEKGELRSAAGIHVTVLAGTAVPVLQFQFEIPSQQKAIRNVLDKK